MGDRQRRKRQRRYGELLPAGAVPVLQQEIRHGRVQQHLTAALFHKYIAYLLPGQSQSHQTAQKIPVGQVAAAAARGPHRRDLRAVRLRHPLRQEHQPLSLRAVIAAPENAGLPRAQQHQKALRCSLLRRGEKACGRGNVPRAALLTLVPHPAQQQPFLRAVGGSVQQFTSVHVMPPNSACGTAWRTRRSLPAAPRGCPPRRLRRPVSPVSGRPNEWWTAGGR